MPGDTITVAYKNASRFLPPAALVCNFNVDMVKKLTGIDSGASVSAPVGW